MSAPVCFCGCIPCRCATPDPTDLMVIQTDIARRLLESVGHWSDADTLAEMLADVVAELIRIRQEDAEEAATLRDYRARLTRLGELGDW